MISMHLKALRGSRRAGTGRAPANWQGLMFPLLYGWPFDPAPARVRGAGPAAGLKRSLAMANEQLKQCERATDDVIVAAEEVRVLLKTLRCNEYGILHDPYDVQRGSSKSRATDQSSDHRHRHNGLGEPKRTTTPGLGETCDVLLRITKSQCHNYLEPDSRGLLSGGKIETPGGAGLQDPSHSAEVGLYTYRHQIDEANLLGSGNLCIRSLICTNPL